MRIDGERDLLARLRFMHLERVDVVVLRILQHADPAGLAFEILLHRLFDAGVAAFFEINGADQRGVLNPCSTSMQG